MDPQKPPSATADMAGKVKGQWFNGGLAAGGAVRGRQYLHPPDFMVHHPGTTPQRRPAVFCPPLPPFIPAHWFGADIVGPAGPDEAYRLALRRAQDINGFAEHAHGASLNNLTLFEYVFEQFKSTPGSAQCIEKGQQGFPPLPDKGVDGA